MKICCDRRVMDELAKDCLHQVLDQIEVFMATHPHSSRVWLDEATKKIIENRFLVKYRYPKHHAHICIIYHRRGCVSVGVNDVQHHAEVDAIKKMLAQYKDFARSSQSYGVLVIRFSKTGVLNNSTPCFHCSKFLRKHLHCFHSISFSDQQGSFKVLTSDMFRSHHFCHISKGHLK